MRRSSGKSSLKQRVCVRIYKSTLLLATYTTDKTGVILMSNKYINVYSEAGRQTSPPLLTPRDIPHRKKLWWSIRTKEVVLHVYATAYDMKRFEGKRTCFLFLVINFYSCWTELCNLSIFGQIPVGVLESTLPPIYFVFLNLIWNSYFNFLQGRVFCTPTNFVINCDTHLTFIQPHSITILFNSLLRVLLILASIWC